MKKQDKEFLKLIGSSIRNRREAKEISQQELADYADLAKTTIQRIELARMNSSLLIVKKICDALEISFADFFKDFK